MSTKKEAQKIDFQSLSQRFSVGEPVKKEIRWKADGEEYTADVYVRRNSCASLEKDIESRALGRNAVATKIATSICDEKGEAIFDYETADSLIESLTVALLGAIAEVNSAKK